MTGIPLPPQRRILGLPASPSGKRSFKALLWFGAAIGVFFLVGTTVLTGIRALDVRPVTIAWYVVMFAMLGAAGVCALAGLFLALHAVIRQGDRALVLAVPILAGIVVAWFAIGEAIGHDEPGTDAPEDRGGPSGHANVRAEETSPGVVRVAFDYLLGGGAEAGQVTRNTVTALDGSGRPLGGVAPVTLPAEGGSHDAAVEFQLSPAQLAAVSEFQVCFTGAAGDTHGCATVPFRVP